MLKTEFWIDEGLAKPDILNILEWQHLVMYLL